MPPVVFLAKAQHLADLAVGEEPLELADLAGKGNVGIEARGEVAARRIGRDRIVRGIEHLVSEPIPLQAQMHDLAVVARSAVAPGNPRIHAAR